MLYPHAEHRLDLRSARVGAEQGPPMKKGGLTRLERFIARLVAQRSCIDAVAARAAPVGGAVWEVGLGNGRTYDHLRERFAGRDIVVFERQLMAHPDSVPPAGMLRLGDFRDTVPAEAALHPGAVAVIHADVGDGHVERSRALGRWLAPHLVQALAPGGYLMGDQPMPDPALEPIALAELVAVELQPDAYFVYRRRD